MRKQPFYVELSIPKTTDRPISIGFHLDGVSEEDVTPYNAFVIGDDLEYDFNVEVLGIDVTE